MTHAAETIKLMRETLGLNQDALAKQLKISRTAVFNYEEGIRLPKRSILFRIIEFAKKHDIDINPSDLLS